MTLSQVGLSIHLGKSVAWVRAQGELVSWRGETWARMEYSNHRCAGYRQCGFNVVTAA